MAARRSAAGDSFALEICARSPSATSSCTTGAAPVVPWLAIDWLLKFLQRHSTWLFVAYRLLFGVGLLAWWSIHGAH